MSDLRPVSGGDRVSDAEPDMTAAEEVAALGGLNLRALERYFDDVVPGARDGELSARLFSGGRSNLTYALTDGSHDWVLRRPPMNHVLATAHDMVREHRVIRALGLSRVPVPEAIALCDSNEVIGAPFHVMSLVAGTPYRSAAELRLLGAERTAIICRNMIDTLVDLHDVIPADVGLEDFGRPAGYLERQVRRWKIQLDDSRSRPVRHAEELYAALMANLPDRSVSSIVHGDYRLDNVLVDEQGEVTAVLDWEMATLGDPLMDLALLMVYRDMTAWPQAAIITNAPQAPGYPTTEEIAGRYAERSSHEVPWLHFYYALACFKAAVLLEGIYFRHLGGQMGSQGHRDIGELAGLLFERGHEAVSARDGSWVSMS